MKLEILVEFTPHNKFYANAQFICYMSGANDFVKAEH